jgi:hypothetical protein
MRSITWRKTGVYVLIVLPVLGLASIAVIARQQEQQQTTSDPVADAARKAKAQKKTEPKPKKVFTNDDFGGGSSTPATTTSGETKDAAGAAATADAPASDKSSSNNNEEVWRKRFREARDKLTQAEQELDILQREAQKTQVQYYADPQKALSEQYTRKDVVEKDAAIQAKKDEIAKLKQHISDMEDDLRKSGGDAGWAR